MQGSNTTHHDLITHAVSTNHHTKVGPYKRDVQHVRACMHDPMNTQGKHTRCSWCAYSECCATLVQCRLPTCFSGRYLWKSLALVQRLVAFPASYQASVSRACDFQRYQVSLATYSPNGKTDSKPSRMFQQPMRLSSTSHLSDGWQESVFPTADAGQTVSEVIEDAPEHLNQHDKKHINQSAWEKTFAKPHLSTIWFFLKVSHQPWYGYCWYWLPVTTIVLTHSLQLKCTKSTSWSEFTDEFPSPIWAKSRL